MTNRSSQWPFCLSGCHPPVTLPPLHQASTVTNAHSKMSACPLRLSPKFSFLLEPHSWNHFRPLSLLLFYIICEFVALISRSIQSTHGSSGFSPNAERSPISQHPVAIARILLHTEACPFIRKHHDKHRRRGKDSSSIPTPAQEVAITTLKDVEEEKVIAWLALLRSIEPGFQLRSGQVVSRASRSLHLIY